MQQFRGCVRVAASLSALALVMVMVGGCGAQHEPLDPAPQRAALADYQAVLDRRDGASALESVTRETLAHGLKILHLAREADRVTLDQQPVGDQLLTLLTRVGTSPEQLAALNGRQWFELAINQGWWPLSDLLGRMQVEYHRVPGTPNVVLVAKSGGEVTTILRFEPVDDESSAWLVDLTAGLELRERELVALQTAADMQRPEFLHRHVEMLIGRELGDEELYPVALSGSPESN